MSCAKTCKTAPTTQTSHLSLGAPVFEITVLAIPEFCCKEALIAAWNSGSFSSSSSSSNWICNYVTSLIDHFGRGPCSSSGAWVIQATWLTRIMDLILITWSNRFIQRDPHSALRWSWRLSIRGIGFCCQTVSTTHFQRGHGSEAQECQATLQQILSIMISCGSTPSVTVSLTCNTFTWLAVSSSTLKGLFTFYWGIVRKSPQLWRQLDRGPRSITSGSLRKTVTLRQTMARSSSINQFCTNITVMRCRSSLFKTSKSAAGCMNSHALFHEWISASPHWISDTNLGIMVSSALISLSPWSGSLRWLCCQLLSWILIRMKDLLWISEACDMRSVAVSV